MHFQLDYRHVLPRQATQSTAPTLSGTKLVSVSTIATSLALEPPTNGAADVCPFLHHAL